MKPVDLGQLFVALATSWGETLSEAYGKYCKNALIHAWVASKAFVRLISGTTGNAPGTKTYIHQSTMTDDWGELVYICLHFWRVNESR